MDELRDEKTAADHYRTARMHHASAHTIRADMATGKFEGDPWKGHEKYDAHMREAQLHAELASARIAAVRLLMDDRTYRVEFGENLSARQQRVVETELEAWGDELAPRGDVLSS